MKNHFIRPLTSIALALLLSVKISNCWIYDQAYGSQINHTEFSTGFALDISSLNEISPEYLADNHTSNQAHKSMAGHTDFVITPSCDGPPAIVPPPDPTEIRR